jgi:hypothetical protein
MARIFQTAIIAFVVVVTVSLIALRVPAKPKVVLAAVLENN